VSRVQQILTCFYIADVQALRDRVRIYAADGRFELFKTTKTYDGEVGREQHHFPPAEKLPA
jgi:hypothetical protein